MSKLNSMTGFSRLEGVTEATTWTWEVKSVNGRNLDLRIRLPYGFDRIDPQIRKLVSAHLSRGSLSINLTVKSEGSTSRLQVNPEALDVVVRSIGDLQTRLDFDRPRPEGVLALRGVLEQVEDSGDDGNDDLFVDVVSGFEQALLALQDTRQNEGEQLRPHFERQVATISDLADRAARVPGHQSEAIRERLNKQIQTLVDDHSAFDAARLHQEAAILMTKADIREEIDRLQAHCQTAHDLLKKGGPVGRRLDHLCQEFNREANTLCSKSNDVEMTGIGLDLKAVIDQFREQVQNLE